jgi:DNA-binding NtrC family response regulator
MALVKRSIFYLDDEEVLLSLFEEMFGYLYDVRTSCSITEARRMLTQCAADIIISDQKMPAIEGTTFLREAAQICPRSYRILLTGQASMMNVVTELTTGVVQHFMVKPWTEGEMLKALERGVTTIDSYD